MRYLLDTNVVSDLSATRTETWHSTSARLAKRMSVPASSLLRNCVTGLPRRAHRGSRPNSKRCLGHLKSCPSTCRPMLPTDCCERDLRRLADQSAPTTCSLRLRRLLLVAPSSPIMKRNSPTSRTFDGRIGCAKPQSASIGQAPCFGFTCSLTARVARTLSPQTHDVH